MSEAKEAPAAAAAAPAAGGGIKAMLPLILNLVLMPAIAFALTQFVLLPKLRAPAATEADAGADPHAAPAEGHEPAKDPHGAPADGGGHGGGAAAKGPVPLSSKIVVNVSGSMGTRFLQANISLVSNKADFKDLVEKFDAQLRDVAAGTLSTKTIADLEKPGARSLIKTELIGQFNIVLGQGAVNDVFLTEFAVQ